MSGFWRWLLDLDRIPADSGPVHLVWTHALPGWVWLLAILVAGTLGILAYRRIAGPRWMRVTLAGVRSATILLVLALLAGPMAELPRERIERDWVLVLADRSRSMTIADADAPGTALGDAPRQTRDDQLLAALRGAEDRLRTLAQEKEVRWFGFHEGLFSLDGGMADAVDAALDAALDGATDGSAASGDADAASTADATATATATDPIPDLGEASGARTDVGRAIQQALQRAGGRPISGIVLLTDGRSTRSLDPAIARRLRADGVPVFAVPLGAVEPIGDLAVGRLRAPSRAFVRDKVPVRIDLDRLGPALARSGATVRLVDETTGELLDERRLEAGSDVTELTLVAEPELAGDATWSVVIDPDEPDLVAENNRAIFPVELVDRPMRVLFVDGYPRWEYHYVKNLLVREQSIESSNFLLSADRDFAQEGNAPITRLPRSVDEWEPYDVIVIGDVTAGFFSPEQMELMRDQVAEAGAGLLWVGGTYATPETYAETVLADLLPFRDSLRLPAIGRPVTMEPTPLAERLGVLQVVIGGERGWPETLRDPETGWSQLYWAQRIAPDALKPTAESLARTVQPFDGAPLPLVVHMRFGAGQSIYVATDEIWRWRYGRGELLPEQFWIQMVRMLARERLAAGGEQAVLQVDPGRTETGRPVQVRVRILDARLANARRPSIEATVRDSDGTEVTRLELVLEPGATERYQATWLPDQAGEFTVRVEDALFADLDLAAILSVREPADELLQPETDHAMLTRLATQTGGRIAPVDDLAAALDQLPNRSITTEHPLRETLWDTPLAFLMLVLLLGVEWVGRRVLRLA